VVHARFVDLLVGLGPGVNRISAMRSPYTPHEQAQVAGLRVSGLTHKQIAQRTGFPRTSVTKILARTPVSEVVTTATRKVVEERLWSVLAEGTEEALRRIHDPKTRAGELAQLLRVSAETYQLFTGGATARTEQYQVTVEQDSELREWLSKIANATDEEIAAQPEERLLRLIRGANP
jgi:hypothetical protein